MDITEFATQISIWLLLHSPHLLLRAISLIYSISWLPLLHIHADTHNRNNSNISISTLAFHTFETEKYKQYCQTHEYCQEMTESKASYAEICRES